MSNSKKQIQGMILQKAYDDAPNAPARKKTKKIEAVVEKIEEKEICEECPVCETCEIIEVPKPDIYDRSWVTLRTYIADPFLPFILIAGVYSVFQIPINAFLKRIFGVSIEDLKYVINRRKERDKELKDGKK